jgi:hypothetical protein
MREDRLQLGLCREILALDDRAPLPLPIPDVSADILGDKTTPLRLGDRDLEAGQDLARGRR